MANPWPPGQTPYVTPDQLAANVWPVGVDFSSIPPGRTTIPAAKTAALAQICMSASTEADGCLNWPLRASSATEEMAGPDFRVTIRANTGNVRMVLQRGPVLAVNSVQVAPQVWPLQWTTVPSGFYRPEYPVIGQYNSHAPSGSGQGGQAIIIAPYIDWCRGRDGWLVQVNYLAGWPHTSLTAAAAASAATLSVDDCTAWGPFTGSTTGTVATIYDAANGTQEAITVTAASVATGPGTLTLSAGLAYAHAAGVMVSSLPTDAIWANVHFAAAMALQRGATSTAVQTQPGRGAGSAGAKEHKEHARDILGTFRRVI